MILMILLIIPLVSALLLLFLRQPGSVRLTGLLSTLVTLGLTFICLSSPAVEGISSNWASLPGLGFSIGCDGISLLLILLTNLVFPFVMLAGWKRHVQHPAALTALILFTQAALLGVFMARNAFLFYIFWELALIPVYFILLIWGGHDRKFITLKFFIYTLAGSLFLLFGIIYLYLQTPGTHTTDFSALARLNLPAGTQNWLFWVLFVGFAVKMPLFPLHTWQPATYTMAPVQGTMILAAVMSKMGIYGALRLLFPVVPLGIHFWQTTVILLGLTGVVYASVIAFRQTNLKMLVAYSSLAHISLMAASLFAWNTYALQGVLFQVLGHGITIIAMFWSVEKIGETTGTLELSGMGGLKIRTPNFSVLFLIAVLGSAALPLTAGFIGELLMIFGLFKKTIWFALAGGSAMVLGAIYLLYAFQRVMLGELNATFEKARDIRLTDYLILIPLVILIIGLGLFPQPVLNLVRETVNSLPDLVNPSTLPGPGI